jgi:ADP-ribose pyrophosphatase
MLFGDKPLGRKLGWRLLSSLYLFESQWFKVRQDALAGSETAERTYTYIEHPGSVFVVPVTADNHVLLVRSYRFTLDAWCWEVPAGTLGDRKNTSPEATALCELAEEAGVTCRGLEKIGEFFLGNGFSNHLAHFYLATGAEASVKAHRDEFEEIAEVASFPIGDIARLILEGAITDGDSALALLLALNHLSFEERRSLKA